MWITLHFMWITAHKNVDNCAYYVDNSAKNVDNLTQNCGKVRKKSITINGKKTLFSTPSLEDKQKSISVDMLWFVNRILNS